MTAPGSFRAGGAIRCPGYRDSLEIYPLKRGVGMGDVKQTRRGVLVEFNQPCNADEDPTVDHIVTLTRKDAEGLWIPDLEKDRWTPSHPEKHTELFTSGTKELRRLRARVTRLAKAWNKQ